MMKKEEEEKEKEENIKRRGRLDLNLGVYLKKRIKKRI